MFDARCYGRSHRPVWRRNNLATGYLRAGTLARAEAARMADSIEKREEWLTPSNLVSVGVVAAAGAFGLSWVFLGGFYSRFGLTPAEVGVGYEDAIATAGMLASALGLVVVPMAVGLLLLVTGVRSGWLHATALGLVTLTVVGVVGAVNNSIGPPTRWVIYSLLVTAAATVLIGTLGRRRRRYVWLIAASTYLLLLPYGRQLGGALSELTPERLSDLRTALVPRWPTVVCVTPSDADSSFPAGPDWTEPWLYFGNQDGTVILARPPFEETVVIRLPSEAVYLVGSDMANAYGAYTELDCTPEGQQEGFGFTAE